MKAWKFTDGRMAPHNLPSPEEGDWEAWLNGLGFSEGQVFGSEYFVRIVLWQREAQLDGENYLIEVTPGFETQPELYLFDGLHEALPFLLQWVPIVSLARETARDEEEDTHTRHVGAIDPFCRLCVRTIDRSMARDEEPRNIGVRVARERRAARAAERSRNANEAPR